MAKSAAFGVIHLGTSFAVGYVLTGSVAIAGAVALVEPAVNTVVHYVFDRSWPGAARRVRARSAAWKARLLRSPAPAPGHAAS